jgi:transcriptional regulator with XRE-family HTH domain
MSSVKVQLLNNFKGSKEYRHAFVEEKVRTQLAVQIRTIREQRAMGRPEFADLMKKAPSWVFRLEDPNQPPPTISTLLQVAEAFDIDLDISFRSFSRLLDQIDQMGPDSFSVPSFEEEVREEAFDRSRSDAELSLIMAELRNSSSGSSPAVPLRPQESGAGLFFDKPHTVRKGGGMKSKRSPRTKRRGQLFLMRRTA